MHLLHHCDYTYRCEACGASEYTTHRRSKKVFDHRYKICPNCSAVKITSADNRAFKVGQFVSIDNIQAAIKAKGGCSPQHSSPIVATKGDRKIHDHDKVLSNPDQLVKYFSEFTWNYLRQTLRENEIKHHQKDPYQISGPADRVAVDELNSLLTTLKVPHHYELQGNPHCGFYRIQVELMITNSETSGLIRLLIKKYGELGVNIAANDTEIAIGVNHQAPQVEAIIATPQPVCIQGRSTYDHGLDEESSVYDAHYNHIKIGAIGGASMQEDGIASVESSDLMTTVRGALADDAKQVFDIFSGSGPTYDEFVKYQYEHNNEAYVEEPRPTHIAKFLGLGKRQVDQIVSDIRIQYLALNTVG